MESSAHKLAAIVFTDIVGYTATTQADEQEAWNQVRKHEEAIKLFTEKYGGEVLNYYGDGSLSPFPSTSDAIEAAAKIQDKMLQTPPVPLRIGIHLGEIYFKDGKFLGDSINIASRIQSEAEAGQIYVSEAVFQTAKNKPNFTFEEVGTRQLKNVDHPVKIHRVQVTGYLGASTLKSVPKKYQWIYWLAGILILGVASFFLGRQIGISPSRVSNQVSSILILPFEDHNPVDEESYFGLGIADEIRSKLSSIQQLEVKSRSSASHVQDKNWSAQEISDKLDVQFILEGSIRHQKDRINLNLSLIDAELDQVVQPIYYQVDLNQNQLLNIQNEIAQTVISLVKVKLLPEEEQKLASRVTDNQEAYLNFLLGKSYLLKGSLPEYRKKAEEYFRRAIQIDSVFAKAYAGLTDVLMLEAASGYASQTEALNEARIFAEKSYRLDPALAESNQAMGTIHLYSSNFIEAEKKYKKAIEIDPSHEVSFAYLSGIDRVLGNYEQALTKMEMAIRLNPFSILYRVNYVIPILEMGRYEEAIAVADSYLLEFPDHPFLLFAKGLSLTMHGSYDEAIATLLAREVPNREFNWILGYAYGLKGDEENAKKVLDYLLDKSETTHIAPSQIALVYLGLGDMENVYSWFKQEDNYYFKIFPMFQELRDDPELKEAFAFLQPFLD